MTIKTTRTQRRLLAKRNAQEPLKMRHVPESEWPVIRPKGIVEVWRSSDFCCQIYQEAECLRLSISTTSLDHNNGRWADGISWDQLQTIKHQVGLGSRQAIEIYPPDDHVINVANMRHLWILPEPIPIGWAPHMEERDQEPQRPISP